MKPEEDMENPSQLTQQLEREQVGGISLVAELENLREVVKFAAGNFSSCMFQGGCLPDGSRPRPKSEWCAHCRIIDAANVKGDE